MKLAHATAVCATFDNADRFYCGVLGLKAIKDFTIDAGLMEKLFTQHRDCRIILFQNDAKKEAVRDGVPPIELVDGEKLITMFEQLELGLKPRTTYDIDNKFFDEFK